LHLFCKPGKADETWKSKYSANNGDITNAQIYKVEAVWCMMMVGFHATSADLHEQTELGNGKKKRGRDL